MFTFTVYDLLAKNLTDRADHPALVLGDKALTYGELGRRVDALAAWLLDRGVRRGDRVGIHLRKGFEEVIATFAVARIGGVFVNVNYQWTVHQLRYIIGDCGIRLLVTDTRKARAAAADGLVDELDGVLVAGKADDDPRVTSWADVPEAPSPDVRGPIDVDLAALLYTSGSTGMPKGVMLTHANLVAGARIVARYIGNTAEDRILGLLPMSFDYGLNQLTTMFLVGGTLVLQPVVLAAEIVKTLVGKAVTGMAAVPPTWIQVVRYLQEAGTDLPALRYVTNSGGKIPAVILEAMPKVFAHARVFLMYGLTEAFRSSFLPPELFEKKMGAIGKAIPNVELYVVDRDSDELCGPNEEGELVHRGSLISRGYWNKPEATVDKFRVCKGLVPRIGQEKVLYSGDIVRRDDDGILWFVGRADGMIKCSGYRISPTEVEEAIYRYEGAGDVVAFGDEDEELGQVVLAAVSAAGGGGLDAEDILRFCRENMPSYMVPRRIHLWQGAMPRTASGKIDRPAVIRETRQAN